MSGLLNSIRSAELLECHGSRVRSAPVAHRVQQWPQRLAERSNRVYHSRRPVGVHGTFDNSRALQVAELLCKRSLRDPGDAALQFGEPLGALKKLFENGGFPASTQNTRGSLHRTKFWMRSHNGPSARLYIMYSLSVTYFHITMLFRSSSILTTKRSAGFVNGTVDTEL